MIIRVFRGQVQPGKQAEFDRVLRTKAIPDFQGRPGMLGVHVGNPTELAPDEFMVTTLWQNLDVLRAFAGERWFEARILPEERSLLRRTFVHHYWAADGERWPPRPTPEQLVVGPFRIDLASRTAELDGRQLDLPPREFAVLSELARRSGRPIPSSDLAAAVWPRSRTAGGEDVRRVVYSLRRLIDDHVRPRPLIRNRRGYGYLLDVTE
jgi:heme-degrading monooxygenase HmoA